MVVYHQKVVGLVYYLLLYIAKFLRITNAKLQNHKTFFFPMSWMNKSRKLCWEFYRTFCKILVVRRWSQVPIHSSEIRCLCLMKLPSETFQNLSYIWNMKTCLCRFQSELKMKNAKNFCSEETEEEQEILRILRRQMPTCHQTTGAGTMVFAV